MDRLFTIPGIWSGGFYEMTLCLGEPCAGGLSEALDVVWNSNMLRGPFQSRDIEPEEQQPVHEILDVGGHLYGVARFQGFELPCGTYSIREENAEGQPLADFVSLYFPLSAIGRHFPVGAYPFADYQAAGRWRTLIDGWFLDVLRDLKDRLHFAVCAIGWEPELTAKNVEEVKKTANSVDRFDGVVLQAEGELRWFPPTRFDILTLKS